MMRSLNMFISVLFSRLIPTPCIYPRVGSSDDRYSLALVTRRTKYQFGISIVFIDCSLFVFTMAQPPNPFAMDPQLVTSLGQGTTYGMVNTSTTLTGSLQHGAAEQWRGLVRPVTPADMGGRLGMTPPITPPRSTSPRMRSTMTLPSRSMSARRRRRDDSVDRRSREREDHRGQQPDEQPLPAGWGSRMLNAEMRIRSLESDLLEAKKIIETNSIDIFQRVGQMKVFVQEVEGRFGQWERAVPERLPELERREETTKAIINQLTMNIQAKFTELENMINTRPFH